MRNTKWRLTMGMFFHNALVPSPKRKKNKSFREVCYLGYSFREWLRVQSNLSMQAGKPENLHWSKRDRLSSIFLNVVGNFRFFHLYAGYRSVVLGHADLERLFAKVNCFKTHCYWSSRFWPGYMKSTMVRNQIRSIFVLKFGVGTIRLRVMPMPGLRRSLKTRQRDRW